jgi:hypothetical protein
MPDAPSTDHRRQIPCVGALVAVLFSRPNIGGEGQPTPGQPHHATLLAKRTDQTREHQRCEIADDRTQCQTKVGVHRPMVFSDEVARRQTWARKLSCSFSSGRRIMVVMIVPPLAPVMQAPQLGMLRSYCYKES